MAENLKVSVQLILIHSASEQVIFLQIQYPLRGSVINCIAHHFPPRHPATRLQISNPRMNEGLCFGYQVHRIRTVWPKTIPTPGKGLPHIRVCIARHHYNCDFVGKKCLCGLTHWIALQKPVWPTGGPVGKCPLLYRKSASFLSFSI